MPLRLLEHYVSTQGEGPNVGKLTQFVRFAGCNLSCPGWPCDTPYAIEPRLYRKEQHRVTHHELVSAIADTYDTTGASNICFTGGEPLIQPQAELFLVCNELAELYGYYDFEIFTNGTQEIDALLIDCCSFVMDWKLPGSGEDSNNEQRITNVRELDQHGNSVKFVIAKQYDLEKARSLWEEHLIETMLEVYVGAAWNRFSNSHVVEYIKQYKLPWRLNVQVQNYIYGAQNRGI